MSTSSDEIASARVRLAHQKRRLIRVHKVLDRSKQSVTVLNRCFENLKEQQRSIPFLRPGKYIVDPFRYMKKPCARRFRFYHQDGYHSLPVFNSMKEIVRPSHRRGVQGASWGTVPHCQLSLRLSLALPIDNKLVDGVTIRPSIGRELKR